VEFCKAHHSTENAGKGKSLRQQPDKGGEMTPKTTMPGWLTRLAALQLSGHDWFESPRKIFFPVLAVTATPERHWHSHHKRQFLQFLL
jgi:hypothetical protein